MMKMRNFKDEGEPLFSVSGSTEISEGVMDDIFFYLSSVYFKWHVCIVSTEVDNSCSCV